MARNTVGNRCRGGLRIACPVLLLVGGCTAISPNEKIQQSIDLVQASTGERPAWLAPWDERPPPWDEHSTLSLDEAVALALRNNRELRADLETIGQANADLLQAGLLQNPRFSLMAMFPSGGGRAMLRSSGFPLQALADLWLIPARQDVAQAQLRQAILRVADRAIETVAEVKRLYARIQYAQRAIELIRANMDIVDQARRLIQTQQAAGKATLVEVNVARIRYLRLQSELVAMEAEYRSLKRQLLMAMGFGASTDQWTVTPLHELQQAIEPPPEEEALARTAEEHRLDLLAANWSLTAAERRIELMRREGWPDVAVGFGFERAAAPRSQKPSLGSGVGNALAQEVLGGGVETAPIMPFRAEPRDVDWTAGPMIDVELPIFDWNQAQTAKALHEFKQEWAEYEARRQSIASKVRETAVMYRQAYDQVRFFREAVLPEVERNLEVVRESYRAGREEVTIFLQVQEDVIMTRLTALAFLRDLLVNRAELERQVGGRLTFDAQTQPAVTSEDG